MRERFIFKMEPDGQPVLIEIKLSVWCLGFILQTCRFGLFLKQNKKAIISQKNSVKCNLFIIMEQIQTQQQIKDKAKVHKKQHVFSVVRLLRKVLQEEIFPSVSQTKHFHRLYLFDWAIKISNSLHVQVFFYDIQAFLPKR